MRNAFGQAVYDEDVGEHRQGHRHARSRTRPEEVLEVIGDENITDPGPASLELAVRAAYPLVVTGGLTDDRGSANNDQPDRRILAKCSTRCAAASRASTNSPRRCTDFAAGEPIRGGR